MGSLLLVEDREGLRKVYATFLRDLEHIVVETGSVEEAKSALEATQFDLVLTDYMLPGANGLDLLKYIRQKDADVGVILMTAFGEIKLAVEAVKEGAFDFLEKPIQLEHLKQVIERALAHQSLALRQDFKRARAVAEAPRLIGSAPSLKSALDLADKVAPSEANCLLLGESGVGKELFALRIHQHSGRTQGEIVSINCASIPAELMESELFGHERGAFTGAVARKLGLVEGANGGTLFLDEIGELPLDLQPKLLRVIQTRQFYRVGGNRLCTSDVRILCATNRDLKQGVVEGWFREDLYYRLAAFPIQIPPLRERMTDLPELVDWFLRRKAYPHPDLSAQVMAILQRYSWPGNIRELESVLERAMILAGGNPLNLTHFPSDLCNATQNLTFRTEIDLARSFKENYHQVEHSLEIQMIRAQLSRYHGNRDQAAAALGFSVKTLYNKIKAYNL